MRIAVTSQNFRTITGHAGKTRRFLIYEAGAGGGAIEVERLDLPKEMSFHEFHEAGSHPIDAVNVLITASSGEGFKRRMAERGIAVLETAQSDPVMAAAAVLRGEPLPEPDSAAGHGHGEQKPGRSHETRH